MGGIISRITSNKNNQIQELNDNKYILHLSTSNGISKNSKKGKIHSDYPPTSSIATTGIEESATSSIATTVIEENATTITTIEENATTISIEENATENNDVINFSVNDKSESDESQCFIQV